MKSQLNYYIYNQIKDGRKKADILSQQANYTKYAIGVTLISGISATAVTLYLFYPDQLLWIGIISLITCTFIAAISFKCWLSSSFSTSIDHDFEAVAEVVEHSREISEQSSLTVTPENFPEQVPSAPQERTPKKDSFSKRDFSFFTPQQKNQEIITNACSIL